MMSGFTNGNAIFKLTITKISQIYLKEKRVGEIFLTQIAQRNIDLSKYFFSVLICAIGGNFVLQINAD
jgi:hypothetical protein